MKFGCGAALAAVCLIVAPAAQAAKDHVTVKVTFESGRNKPAVSEDPIQSTADEDGFVWEIATPGYRFADQGITISPGGKHECRFQAPTIVRCGKLGHQAGDTYHYTVRIVREAQPDKPATLDPTISYH